MKLVAVDFHNFRSVCETLTECRLDVEPEITWLIGASESGKSNLLQAMSTFETGEYVLEDVPRSVITGVAVDPPHDLPMVSACYKLDQDEAVSLFRLHQKTVREVTFQRRLTGGIEVTSPSNLPDRSYESILGELEGLQMEAEEPLGRFLRSYSRQRTNHQRQDAPSTQAATIRLNKLLHALDEEDEDEVRIREIPRLLKRFIAAIDKLPSELKDEVPTRSSQPAYDLLERLRVTVEELERERSGLSQSLLETRPRFRLVSSDPLKWLKGEYSQQDLLNLESGGSQNSLESARLLLELANLDFSQLGNLPDYLVLDLLKEAGETATDRLNDYWSQEKIAIEFDLAPKTGNLILYVVTDDHRGLPTQRSYGFRWYFEFLLTYAHAQYSDEPIVLLFDEPGIHLHPKAQEDVKRLLKTEISKRMQVILTTHLPALVDTSRIENVRGVVKNESGKRGTRVINEEYSPDHGETTWDVMLKAIGVYGPEGFYPGRTIVTEGLSDRQYLIGMARYLVDRGDTRATEIASGIVRLHPGYGISSLSPICQKLLSNGSTFVILLDSDEAGKAGKRSLSKKYPPRDTFKGFVQVAEIEYDRPYFHDESKNADHELEDLFGPVLYAEMVNKIFGEVAEAVGPFSPLAEEPPSMLEKAAKEWLCLGGEDPDSMHRVAGSFLSSLNPHLPFSLVHW